MLRIAWRVALGAAVVLLMLVPAASAQAAETTIGFDHYPGGELVPAGIEVTNQWQAEGLQLGKAEALGDPKPGSGNCGPPVVAQGTATTPAVSPPNYALLPECPVGAGPLTRGTYGALLNHPHGQLSVEVRSLPLGSSEVEVIVTAYNGGGKEIEHVPAKAKQTSWTKIMVPNSSKAQISYFSIEALTPNNNEVAIDDLSFEKVEEETKKEEHKEEGKKEETKEEAKKEGGSAGSTPPTPPVASLALTTPSPHAGEPIALSGAASTPGTGHIISYGWNFRGGSTIETSTGTNPLAHVMLSPGVHTIALTVTNSSGEHSTSRFSLSLPTNVHAHIPDGGEGECQSTLAIGDAHLLAECIQKSGSGYVIEGQLQINGLTLVPKSGGFLRIKNNPFIAAGGTATELTGASVFVELPNTPIGDMVLGERNLESEPVILELHSSGLPRFEGIAHGLGFGRTGASHRAHAADESKTLLMAFGVGKECSGSEKGASCCPPKSSVTACATLPGNFPLTGQVDVYLNKQDQALIDVQVGLSLKEVNFEATGALEIRANLESGIELQSLKFEIGEASLAPIFKVKGASFEYFFPEYAEESKRDSWQAKGTITFGENVAELEAELAFKHGEFQSAAMKFKATPGVPIYPGIDLNEIGANVGVHPLAFGGSLGASIAEVLELELAFKFREATATELGFFGGKGTLSLKEHEIATLAADVYSDGYTDAQLKIHLQVPFPPEEAFASIEGELGFWDEPATGKWEADGRVAGKIWIIEAEIAGLINNHYVAGCGDIHAIITVSGYGFYSFANGESGFEGFVSNCKERLEPYREHPAVKHSGGFVGESILVPPGPRRPWTGVPFSAGLGAGGLGAIGHGLDGLGSAGGVSAGVDGRGLASEVSAGVDGHSLAGEASAGVASGGEYETVDLAGSPRGEDLRITSSSGTPVVTLVGPGGQTFTTPSVLRHPTSDGSQFVAELGPNPHQAIVFLRKPQRGVWRIEAAPGSGPIGKVEGAAVAPQPTIRAQVHHRGRTWSLAYRIGHHSPGMRVSFLERGRDSDHLLATVGSAHGVIRFAPQEALGRPRQIIAVVLSPQGVPLQKLTVGHYTAPGPFRPGRPRHLRIARQRASALLTWTPVAGARSYRIKIRGSDGRLETHFRTPGNRSVSIPNVLEFESFTATVTAVGGKDLLPGPPASVRLSAVKPPRYVRPRRSRGAGAHGKRSH